MNNSKIHPDHEKGSKASTLHHSKSKRLAIDAVVEESRELKRMEHLALDRVTSIQFCVDGAVGMPMSATASRVTARLLDHDRRQIGEPSASAVSHPDSPVASPIFDLQASWRGKSHYIFVGCIFITSSFTFVRKYVDAYNNNSMSNRYFRKA